MNRSNRSTPYRKSNREEPVLV